MRIANACLACLLPWMTVMSCLAAEDSVGTHAPAAAQSPDVISEIDHLLLLQDATARGRRQAVQDQKNLLLAIGKELSGLQERSTIFSVYPIIAYVMSGGDPRAAEKIAMDDRINPRETRLLQAAVQFMQGDRNAALDVISKSDPLQLPGRIAGRIALAQALLAIEDARQTSYSVALSAMPGTLVEESALRRSALAYAEARDEPAFWRRLERYGRRFPTSVYAASFWLEAIAAIVTWAEKQPAPDRRRLDAVLTQRPLAERLRLYIALSRQAAATSNAGLTAFAASRLNRIAEPGSAEQELGRFYMTLYDIVSPEGDAALHELRSLRRNLLGAQELALLDAALSLGAMIERPEPETPAPGEDAEQQSVQEARGATLLADSSRLLAELK